MDPFPQVSEAVFFTALGRVWGGDHDARFRGATPFIDPIHAVICIGYRSVHPVCCILNRVVVGIGFNCWKRLHHCSVFAAKCQKPLHRVAALFCIPVINLLVGGKRGCSLVSNTGSGRYVCWAKLLLWGEKELR